jgi:uncharacterized protein (DUF433 family)
MTTDRAEINPDVMTGRPIIRDARIPVEVFVRKLSEAGDRGRPRGHHPRLTREDIHAAGRMPPPRWRTTGAADDRMTERHRGASLDGLPAEGRLPARAQAISTKRVSGRP